jgi:hypothetical protein
MEFTVELRYRSGSSTVLSTEADTADEALQNVRDPRRPLVGIHITAPAANDGEVAAEPHRSPTYTSRRVPVRHRPSRRQR